MGPADKPRMRPLIGVTTSELRPSGAGTLRRQGEPAHPEMALGMTYLQALERAGAVPVVLPPCVSDLESLISRLDGVCLSGGPDIDPEGYGEETRNPQLGATEPGLDAYELALAQLADARGMPVLGICRGVQALNVARGGTLHQHVGDFTDGSIVHRQTERGRITTHSVRIEPGSRLARVMGVTAAEVNSFHHQSADRLGQGLREVAWAPDGVVEGIEDEGASLYFGVQWHVESLVDRPEHLALFRELVEEADAYGQDERAVRAA